VRYVDSDYISPLGQALIFLVTLLGVGVAMNEAKES
jgi:hypothetical protein